MDNIMLPSPHKILSVLKETKAEYTFRVEYDGETDHGQFFQLSIPQPASTLVGFSEIFPFDPPPLLHPERAPTAIIAAKASAATLLKVFFIILSSLYNLSL